MFNVPGIWCHANMYQIFSWLNFSLHVKIVWIVEQCLVVQTEHWQWALFGTTSVFASCTQFAHVHASWTAEKCARHIYIANKTKLMVPQKKVGEHCASLFSAEILYGLVIGNGIVIKSTRCLKNVIIITCSWCNLSPNGLMCVELT